MKVYVIWLLGVFLWNFGYPEALPIEDVLAAIILSFISFALKKYFVRFSGLIEHTRFNASYACARTEGRCFLFP